MDQHQMLKLISQIEQRLDRAFEQDLRPLATEVREIKQNLQYMRQDLDWIKKYFEQLQPVIRELRQESEMGKQSDLTEKTDLNTLKQQLIRIQSDLQMLLQSTRQDPIKQGSRLTEERF